MAEIEMTAAQVRALASLTERTLTITGESRVVLTAINGGEPGVEAVIHGAHEYLGAHLELRVWFPPEAEVFRVEASKLSVGD